MICLEELTEDVEMRLTIEVVREEKILRLGALGSACITDGSYVIILHALTECAPALDPATVSEARITLLEAAHDCILLLTLCELDIDITVLEGGECDLAALGIVLYRKRGEPALILRGPEEVRVALTVEDVAALVILVTADAVGVLTKNDVSACSDHSAAYAHKSR